MKNEAERAAGRKNILMIEAVLIAILVTALTVVLVLYFAQDGPGKSGEVDLEEMESLVPVTEPETQTEPETETYVSERIHFNDPVLGSISVPSAPNIRRHEYSWAYLTRQDQRFSYESEQWRSKTGVDVSYFQGTIDWEKVKADGIDFAMIRLGLRGYGTGNIVMDEKFTENINGALDAGLEVGVYFFSQALNEEEAVMEAETVLSMLSGYDITFPVGYDLEVIDDSGSRTRELSDSAMTENAKAFCDVIRNAGYDAVYYASRKTALLKYDMAQLQDFGLWYAQPGDYPEIPYAFTMWQYTSEGKVDGIDYDVSLNLYIEPKQSSAGEE